MAVNSFTKHCTLPSDLSWKSHQHPGFNRRTETVWPTPEQTDRILTRNYGDRLVVCLPLSAHPTLERSAPVFTDIMKSESGWSTDEIASLFDAVEQHLQPNYGLGGFHYGVQYDTVQTVSNTPGRFLVDLKSIETYDSYTDDTPSPQLGRSLPPSTPVGAGVWPTTLGWFYLEATQHASAVTYSVRYGLLRHGPLLNPADVIPFFDSVSDDQPRTQDGGRCGN